MDLTLIELIITAGVTIVSSSGIWAFLDKRRERNSTTNQLLRGLAYNALITQGRYHINRGEITPSEYSDLHNMLYLPYKAMGGNGSIERLLREIDKLPIRDERDSK